MQNMLTDTIIDLFSNSGFRIKKQKQRLEQF